MHNLIIYYIYADSYNRVNRVQFIILSRFGNIITSACCHLRLVWKVLLSYQQFNLANVRNYLYITVFKNTVSLNLYSILMDAKRGTELALSTRFFIEFYELAKHV